MTRSRFPKLPLLVLITTCWGVVGGFSQQAIANPVHDLRPTALDASISFSPPNRGLPVALAMPGVAPCARLQTYRLLQLPLT
jgi:hypothetical protein